MSDAPLVRRPALPDTLGAFLAAKRSPSTREAYRRDLMLFAARIAPGTQAAEASRAIAEATVLDAIGWRDAMTAAGLRPASVQRRLAALRTFYRFAQAAGAVPPGHNPAALVESPRVEPERQKRPYLDAGEAHRLLAAPDTATVGGMRDRAILGLMACSGLRRAEVAGMSMGGLHRGDASVIEAVTVTGKGGKVRTLNVDRETAEALDRYLAADGRGIAPELPVFRGRRGNALTPDGVDNVVRVCAKRAGIAVRGGGQLAPHALRRTFATTVIDDGKSLDTLRRALGHSDPRTTARYVRRRESTVTVTYGPDTGTSEPR